MSRLTTWQKQQQRRKEREEKKMLKLSLNGASRILDRRHPVTEINPDDESLDDCNFVEQGVAVEPLMFADESDPDLEDNLGDECDDQDGDADYDPPAQTDRYADMAERFDVPEIIRGDDDSLDRALNGIMMTDRPADEEIVVTRKGNPQPDVAEKAKQTKIAAIKKSIASDKLLIKAMQNDLSMIERELPSLNVNNPYEAQRLARLKADRRQILDYVSETGKKITDARRELKWIKGKPARKPFAGRDTKPLQVKPVNLDPKLFGEIADEASFVDTVNEQMLRLKQISDSREAKWPRKSTRSWKHRTTQAAQFLRHTWRGVRMVETIRGTVPVTVVDATVPVTIFVATDGMYKLPEVDDEKSLRVLLGDYINSTLYLGPLIKDDGSLAFY